MIEAEELLDECCPFCERSAAPDCCDCYECAAPGMSADEDGFTVLCDWNENCPVFPNWGAWRAVLAQVSAAVPETIAMQEFLHAHCAAGPCRYCGVSGELFAAVGLL